MHGEMRIAEQPHVNTAVVKTHVTLDELPQVMGQAFGKVYEVAARQHVEPTLPFARYLGFGPEIDLEAGMLVREAIDPDGDVASGELPEGRVVSTIHLGPYDELAQTYADMQRYMAENGLEAAGPMWEVYLTDPGAEPDPQKWRTEIFQPIA
jgi:effector-binding domain-containing protein